LHTDTREFIIITTLA